MYGDRGIQWQKCPFSRTRERMGEGGGHFLNPTPQTQHPDQNQEGFWEPERTERRTKRRTGSQTASLLKKKKKKPHFILESKASAGEWGQLLCENARLATGGEDVGGLESRKENGQETMRVGD